MLFVCVTASQTSSDTTASAGDDVSLEDKPAKKSKKGKKVQWPADDANLATFHFFEMDEDERGQFILGLLENKLAKGISGVNNFLLSEHTIPNFNFKQR